MDFMWSNHTLKQIPVLLGWEEQTGLSGKESKKQKVEREKEKRILNFSGWENEHRVDMRVAGRRV